MLSTNQPNGALVSPSDNEATHTPFDREPKGFGPDRSSISILPFEIRHRILVFCTEPRDLMALIQSSSAFYEPFCANRHLIIEGIVKEMRGRFGGDIPVNCLMAARLRNIRSQWHCTCTEALEDDNKATIERTFKGSLKGVLLHTSYSLRALGFISEILVEAEGLMMSYSSHAWNISKTLHTDQELVLSAKETKRFLDVICLYDAYCTAFFHANEVLLKGKVGLRQRFFEDYGGPEKNIARFYSIFYYLWDFYRSYLGLDGNMTRQTFCRPTPMPQLVLVSPII
ncbi:hypothetical protein FBEOM_14015 [Fusarium beomiforme]|uniref:F-box domain-containing protein n=1 Tax=Fusarium beomiforme TaxID=44412 RepID=A0A9P5A5P0_9HYPO|nr:hypothetical protein FBEOM_14015 [Fusarium beomiforme]